MNGARLTRMAVAVIVVVALLFPPMADITVGSLSDI